MNTRHILRFLTIIALVTMLCLAGTAPVFAMAAEETRVVSSAGVTVKHVDIIFGVVSYFTIPAGFTITSKMQLGDVVLFDVAGLTDCQMSVDAWNALALASPHPFQPVAVRSKTNKVVQFGATVRTMDATPGATYLLLGTHHGTDGRDYYAVRQADDNRQMCYILAEDVQNVQDVQNALVQSEVENSPTLPTTAHPDEPFGFVRVILIFGIIIPAATIVIMVIRRLSSTRAHREIYDAEEGNIDEE